MVNHIGAEKTKIIVVASEPQKYQSYKKEKKIVKDMIMKNHNRKLDLIKRKELLRGNR